MEPLDPNEPPTGAELMRRLNAMQAALMDETLPRELRHNEVLETYSRGQGLAIIGMASLVALRAGTGLRLAPATTIPLPELGKLLPESTVPAVRAGVLTLCWMYDKHPNGTYESDMLTNELTESGHGLDAFVALCYLSIAMADLVVKLDPQLATRSDLLRREALEFEARRARS